MANLGWVVNRFRTKVLYPRISRTLEPGRWLGGATGLEPLSNGMRPLGAGSVCEELGKGMEMTW